MTRAAIFIGWRTLFGETATRGAGPRSDPCWRRAGPDRCQTRRPRRPKSRTRPRSTRARSAAPAAGCSTAATEMTSGNNCRITARVPTMAGWHRKPKNTPSRPPVAESTIVSLKNCETMSRLLGAQRAANADLARALGDGGQHDVHDADAADQQGNAGDQHQQQVEHHLQDLRPVAAVPWAPRSRSPWLG